MKAMKKSQGKTVKKAVKMKTPDRAARAAKPLMPSMNASKAGSKVPAFSKDRVNVVEMGPNAFVIAINGARNFFERDEMRSLVRICHQASNESDGATRLYSWFSGKRKDVLIDTRVYDPHDASLKTIYRHLLSTYALAN
jgi:hypothetical protein